MKDQEGPTVRIDARCFDCRHCHSESYQVQGDSGHKVYCDHPQLDGMLYIGDTTWKTPEWCPFDPYGKRTERR